MSEHENIQYAINLAHTIKSLEGFGIYFSDDEWEDIFGIKEEDDND